MVLARAKVTDSRVRVRPSSPLHPQSLGPICTSAFEPRMVLSGIGCLLCVSLPHLHMHVRMPCAHGAPGFHVSVLPCQCGCAEAQRVAEASERTREPVLPLPGQAAQLGVSPPGCTRLRHMQGCLPPVARCVLVCGSYTPLFLLPWPMLRESLCATALLWFAPEQVHEPAAREELHRESGGRLRRSQAALGGKIVSPPCQGFCSVLAPIFTRAAV